MTHRVTGHGPGYRTKYEYDALGQVRSGHKYWADGTPVAGQQFDYAHDDIGNRTRSGAGGDENGANLRISTYTANNLNQYTTRTVPGAVDILGLALGTTTPLTVNGEAPYRKVEYFRKQLPVANAAPVWQAVQIQAGSETANGTVYVPPAQEQLRYDPDGNLTNDGRWSFCWDAENRLVSLQPSGLAAVPDGAKRKLRFGYDAQSRRVESTASVWTNGAWWLVRSNRFLYDGWNLLAELNATNFTLIRSFAWGLDLSGSAQGAGGVGGLLWVSDSATINNEPSTHFVACDGNGNVAALVDSAAGKVSARYEYGPFGEVLRVTGPMAKANPFRFSTKYQDNETDLVYYGYRSYNPSTGRWMSRDPIEERGGLNVYATCRNSTIDRFDLLGNWDWSGSDVGDTENLDDRLDACDKTCVKIGPFDNHLSCYCFCWRKFSPTPRKKTQAQLIAEWRLLNPGREWPTCSDGTPAEAHHTKPLADGGADEGSNIEPMCLEEHKDHHKEDTKRWGKRAQRMCTPKDPLDYE